MVPELGILKLGYPVDNLSLIYTCFSFEFYLSIFLGVTIDYYSKKNAINCQLPSFFFFFLLCPVSFFPLQGGQFASTASMLAGGGERQVGHGNFAQWDKPFGHKYDLHVMLNRAWSLQRHLLWCFGATKNTPVYTKSPTVLTCFKDTESERGRFWHMARLASCKICKLPCRPKRSLPKSMDFGCHTHTVYNCM